MEGEKKNRGAMKKRNRAVRNKKVELMANTLTTCNEFAC